MVVGSPEAFEGLDADRDGAFLDLHSELSAHNHILSRHRLLCFESASCDELVPQHCAWLLDGLARPVAEAELGDFRGGAVPAALPPDGVTESSPFFAVVCADGTHLFRADDADAVLEWVLVVNAAMSSRPYVFPALGGGAAPDLGGGDEDVPRQRYAAPHVHRGWLSKKNRRTRFWHRKYYTVDASAGELVRWSVPGGEKGGAEYPDLDECKPDKRYPLGDCTVLDLDPMALGTGGDATAMALCGRDLPGGGRSLHFRAVDERSRREWVVHLCAASRMAHLRRLRDDSRWAPLAERVARAGSPAAALDRAWPLLLDPRPLGRALRFRLWRAFSGFDAFELKQPDYGERVLLQFQRDHPDWPSTVFDYFHARLPRFFPAGGDGDGGAEARRSPLLDDDASAGLPHVEVGLPATLEYRVPRRSFSLEAGGVEAGGASLAASAAGHDEDDRRVVRDLLRHDLGIGLELEEQMKLKLVLLALAGNNPDVEYCPMLLRLGSLMSRTLGEADYFAFLQHLMTVSRGARPGGRASYLITSARQTSVLYLAFRELLARRHPGVAEAAGEDDGGGDDTMFAWWRSWVEEMWCVSLPRCTRSRCLDLFMVEGDAAFVRTALAVVSLRRASLAAAVSRADFVRRLRAACGDMYDVRRVFGAVRDQGPELAAEVAALRADRAVLGRVPPAWVAALSDPHAPPAPRPPPNPAASAPAPPARAPGRPVAYYAWARRLLAASSVLRHPEEMVLAGGLPAALRARLSPLEPVRAYDMAEHGHGVAPLYACAARHGGEQLFLLLVRTMGGEVLGALLSDAPRPYHAFFGSAPAAVCRLRPVRSSGVWAWGGGGADAATEDEEGGVLFCDESGLGVGPDGAGCALRVDAALRAGSSHATSARAFASPALLSGGRTEFEVAEAELIAFTAAM